MKTNHRKKSLFKILVCSLLVAGLVSFAPASVDPCQPTDAQFRQFCESSTTETCYVYWIGGACDGIWYGLPYNRNKQ